MNHLSILTLLLGGGLRMRGRNGPGDDIFRSCNVDPSFSYYRRDAPMDNAIIDPRLSPLMEMDWPLKDGEWYRRQWREHKIDLDLSDSETSPETHSNAWTNRQPSQLPDISQEELEMMYEVGVEDYQKNVASYDNSEVTGKKHPPYRYHGYRRTSRRPQTPKESLHSYVREYVTRAIMEKFNNKPAAVDLQFLGPVSLRCDSPYEPACNATARFRSADGSCNNLDNPMLGAASTPFRRLVPQNYDDGVSSFRKSVSGSTLPNARFISTTTNRNGEEENNEFNCFTVLHMTIGQFLDHDLTFASLPNINEECCGNTSIYMDPSCAPITLPADDPFYSPADTFCMEFVRSVPAYSCYAEPREQINELSQYIDLSQVYGSTEEETDKLRAHEDGLLKVQDNVEGPDLLPIEEEEDNPCFDEEKAAQGLHCFLAGDFRVNEQILLTVIHTTWVREHNRIARELKEYNPSLTDDERLFQEARRITIAEWQNIVYNEFIPGVIGLTAARSFGLLPKRGGRPTDDYNSSLSAVVSAEFATAAFRFGHSMIPAAINEMTDEGVSLARVLNSVLEAPFPLYEEGVEEGLVRGCMNQRANPVDSSFTSQITGQLFRKDSATGLDLIALNIQRGRDHGLGTYLEVRRACGFPNVSSFDDLQTDIEPEPLMKLKEAYSDVRDIDLFIGGISEKPLTGAQVGPTFVCIMGDQFQRLKWGDRFWFEFSGSPAAFRKRELRQLRKVSMARIICDNHPSISTIQRWPLNLLSPFNPAISCFSANLPRLDIRKFRMRSRRSY